MTNELIRVAIRAACLTVLLACMNICTAQGQQAPAVAGIPESEITALLQELAGQNTQASAVKKRRAWKSIIRKGNSLLDANPTAPNHYRVLAIVFQSQKRLLGLDNSERNREALFETCATLAKAPDPYAKLRLEADFLLMEIKMSRKKADLTERTQALADLIQRYRDTPAEAKSLMMGSLIAPKLEAFELEKQIQATMDERFAGDLDMIGWRRTHRDYAHFRLMFQGEFTRIDGTTLTFPIDGMGHTCLMYFWSGKSPGFETQLLAMKDLQSRFPHQFKVFSFNLDELVDGGGNTLKRLGLDWTVMRLPGGKNSQIYRVYAGRDPVAVRVNAHGHALLPSTLVRTMVEEMPMEQNLDELRYLAQLQSLLVGDFLVTGTEPAKMPARSTTSVPADVLTAIQGCFTAVPFRYRLTHAVALANYQKAESLSRDAITRYPDAPDLWRVRNRRIIALIGMWTLAFEPKHLEAAAVEAQAALAALTEKSPRGADVVARFCLAKTALRLGEVKPESVLESLIKATGGNDASAYGAATILAMDANRRDLHLHYREKLLALNSSDPALWPVLSFLRDQNHRVRLFKANYYLPPSRARRAVRSALRRNVADPDSAAGKNQLLKAGFITLTGGKLSLPEATDGKLTLLMFVEPPADPGADFPVEIKGSVTEDAKGKVRETLGVMQHAFQLSDQHVNRGIKVIAAFLSDDKDRVQALMEKSQWPCQAVMVPGGLRNPAVRQLGILSADRVPNIFLLRPDGTIAWSLSGIVHPQHKSEGIGELLHTIRRAMRANIEPLAMEQSFSVLKQGKFRDAARQFSGPFPAGRPQHDGWLAPQLHGRALAHIGLKDWQNALSDIDAAIESHQWVFNSKKPCGCDRVATLLRTKAMVLEKLGQGDEAKEARKRAATATQSHSTSRYGLYHDQLDAIKPR